MRAMREAVRMQRDHTRLDVVTAEELAPMIEDDFVEIVVRVEERHLERSGIALDRPRHERADYKSVGDKGRVHTWRHMIAMAHHRADVAPVELYCAEISLPAHGVQWIERVSDEREGISSFYRHLPFSFVSLRTKFLIELWRLEDRGIEKCVRSQDAPLRKLVGAVRRFDQQSRGAAARLKPPHRPARKKNIVTVAISEVPEVAKQIAFPFMYEEQFVPVGIARQRLHGLFAVPDSKLDMCVRKQHGRGEQSTAFFCGIDFVEGARTQGSFERAPSRRRMLVIKMRRRTEKAVAADLALECTRRQIGVRLARDQAFATRKFDPVFSTHPCAPERDFSDCERYSASQHAPPHLIGLY